MFTVPQVGLRYATGIKIINQAGNFGDGCMNPKGIRLDLSLRAYTG